MALTDTQIERYSRQIILPEVGGRGQERLLNSAVIMVGTGPLTVAVVPYLAGAGLGTLVLRPLSADEVMAAARLAERASQINPDVRAEVGAPMGPDRLESITGCDVLCDASGRREIAVSLARSAHDHRMPIVSAGVSASLGWVSVRRKYEKAGDGCVFCGWLEAGQGATENDSDPLAPTVVGAVAALVATFLLEGQIGFERIQQAKWLRYDAQTLTLEERVTLRREDCPVCRDCARKNKCHPILDS